MKAERAPDYSSPFYDETHYRDLRCTFRKPPPGGEHHLTRPVLSHSSKNAKPSRETAVLVNLPVEMIYEIYSHLDDLVDAVCLSITCQVLWEVGRSDLHRRAEKSAATYSWAGDRIICLGAETRSKDLPANLLAPEEVKELLSCTRTMYFYPFGDAPPGCCFTVDRFLQQSKFYLRGAQFWESWMFRGLCRREPVALLPMDALRNLTKREYVRNTALLDLQAVYADTHVDMEDLGFGQVVVVRVCCSADQCVGMAYDGGIHRGVWAGDRFDVVGAEWLEARETDATWTDVSEAVMSEVEAIWNAKYPAE
ncbi:hypothetical protein C8R44DRAFT_883365 [Mycena epipterygia]|nr:hypothetical protein C8R44DRAFT_883365 [Mycena epipterygia]